MSSLANLQPPKALQPHHDVSSFCSGVESLDTWLKKRALSNEKNDASRTYVVCIEDRVVGYYTLAAGSVRRELAPKRLQRNMPNSVPVMLLGRLAVDQKWRNQGIGRGMLRNAIFKTLDVADVIGMKAVLVHAISKEAAQFYERYGFKPSLIDSQLLMLPTKEISASM